MALPAGVILDGPFRTEAEVKKHTYGEWDPNWDSRND
jgi:hypothetical protein